MATAAATLTASNSTAAPAAAAPTGGDKGTPAAAAPAGAAGNALPTAASTGWWDSVKDPAVKEWLGTKKYPDADSALQAHWGLERLFGADKAGNTVVIPREDDAAGWKALATKLGVPEKADDYKLPMPAGVDDTFAKTAASWFHEAGVPPRAATAIAAKWNEYVTGQVQQQTAAESAESAKQMDALGKEWGTNFTGNRELAQRGYRDFAKQFGLDDKAALERAESVLGAANLTRFFQGLGKLNSESGFAGSDARGTFGVTPAEAMKQINQITADRASGKIDDRQWRMEFEPLMNKLGPIAYSGMTA